MEARFLFTSLLVGARSGGFRRSGGFGGSGGFGPVTSLFVPSRAGPGGFRGESGCDFRVGSLVSVAFLLDGFRSGGFGGSGGFGPVTSLFVPSRAGPGGFGLPPATSEPGTLSGALVDCWRAGPGGFGAPGGRGVVVAINAGRFPGQPTAPPSTLRPVRRAATRTRESQLCFVRVAGAWSQLSS